MVWVDSLGPVDSVAQVLSSNRLFLPAAENAIRSWRFRPFTPNRTGLSRFDGRRRVLPVDFRFRSDVCPTRRLSTQTVAASDTGLVVTVLIWNDLSRGGAGPWLVRVPEGGGGRRRVRDG